MKACLDLHDFSIVNNRLDLLKRLKAKWPNFKVSLFTIPVLTPEDMGPYLIRGELLKQVRECLDWIQIIPHGMTHHGSEMKYCNYEMFKNFVIPTIKETFEKDGLPYEKGFCAPHWRWSEAVVRNLDEMGWWGAIDPRQPNMLSPKRFYKYSHAIDDELDGEVLKLHGHVYGTSNDLGACMANLLRLPDDIDWHFVTDFVEEHDTTL